MKKQNAHQLHARLFESVFSNQQVAKDYLEQLLPKEIAEGLILEKLKVEKDSFVTPELKQWFSDIIYSCPFGEKEEEVLLTFLLDHKSSPDYLVYIQLLRYMTSIWVKQLENKASLTPILPIIFYHGEKKWVAHSFFDLFPHVDDVLKPYLPSFDFHLTDLSKYSNKEILSLKVGFLINTLMTFKHYKNENYIRENFKLFVEFPSTEDNSAENLFRTLLVYIFKITEIRAKELPKLLESIDEPEKNKIMSTYDSILSLGEKRGKKEGKKEGKQIGAFNSKIDTILRLHEKGMDTTFIAEVVKETKEFVENVIAGEIKKM